MTRSKRLLANVATLCAVAAIATPAMATNYTLNYVNTGPGADSWDINDSAPAVGVFTDVFSFTIPGVLPGNIEATLVNVGKGANNIDIVSAWLTESNTTLAALDVANVGAWSTAVTDNVVAVLAGHTYALHVTYKAFGAGDMLIGNVAFLDPPAAAPESATWALLMLGFGAVGYALRSSGRRAATLA
jgi:hypothetical protein